jgi:predicted Rossmann fold flavoprotein
MRSGISRDVAEATEDGEVTLEIDFLPNVPNDRLATDYMGWLVRNPRRTVRSSFEQWVPNRLCDEILDGSSAALDLSCAKLEKKARNRILELLKSYPIGIVKGVPLEKGEVVAGGVALDEVDPKTMRSKMTNGLYLCGEVLDVAGPVGGYNLQAAFATGYMAGEMAAKEALGL